MTIHFNCINQKQKVPLKEDMGELSLRDDIFWGIHKFQVQLVFVKGDSKFGNGEKKIGFQLNDLKKEEDPNSNGKKEGCSSNG